MFIGSCNQSRKCVFFLLGMNPDFPGQSNASPRINEQDGETDWLNPGHKPTSLARG